MRRPGDGIFEQFLKERPALHRLKDGSSAQWGLHEKGLRLIWENASETSKTIETGGGLTTAVFAMSGADHTAVFPAYHAFIRDTVAEYLAGKRLAAPRVRYVLGESQRVLPAWDESGYDLVVLDGDHAFPTPFIDWYYLAPKMNVGGLLVLDDTWLWPVRMLREFLRFEPEWRLVAEESSRLSVFRLVAPWRQKWWAEQVHTVAHSDLHPQAGTLVPPSVRCALPSVFPK